MEEKVQWSKGIVIGMAPSTCIYRAERDSRAVCVNLLIGVVNGRVGKLCVDILLELAYKGNV